MPHRGDDSGMHVLPRQPVGWWALALLVVTGLFAAGWGAVENVVHNSWFQILLAGVLGVTSLGTGVAATFKKHDHSILLGLVFAVVAFEMLLGLLFGLAMMLGG